LVRFETDSQDVVDVADHGENVRLDLEERLAREARLELDSVALAVARGALVANG
jgi:hypothetical protein